MKDLVMLPAVYCFNLLHSDNMAEYTVKNRRRLGVGKPTPGCECSRLHLLSIESYP